MFLLSAWCAFPNSALVVRLADVWHRHCYDLLLPKGVLSPMPAWSGRLLSRGDIVANTVFLFFMPHSIVVPSRLSTC